MKVKVEERGPGNYVVRPEGDVDMSTSPELRATLAPLLAAGTQCLVVDLSQVPYMDSSGIATLVEGLQLSRKNSSKFILAGLGPSVRAAFEVAHLMEVFQVAPSVESVFQEGWSR